MKAFYKNAAAFMLVLLLVIVGYDYLSMKEPMRNIIAELTDSYGVVWGFNEIRPYVEKVQTKDDTTQLIIGDSVCHQMFTGLQEYNPDISIVGSNAGVTMAGQYILAYEYIENHPEATDIHLFVLPGSLAATFDTSFGYKYVVMPFVETDTLTVLDQNTIDDIKSVYGSFFIQKQVVQLIHESPLNLKLYLNLLQDSGRLNRMENNFDLADQYLVKLYELCEEKGIKFHLYAAPVCEGREKLVDEMIPDYSNTKLAGYFPDFLNDTYYYPMEQTDDGVHFGADYSNQEFFNEKLKIVLAGTDLEKVLRYE